MRRAEKAALKRQKRLERKQGGAADGEDAEPARDAAPDGDTEGGTETDGP